MENRNYFRTCKDPQLPLPKFNIDYQMQQNNSLHTPQSSFNQLNFDNRYFTAPDGTVYDIKMNRVVKEIKTVQDGYWGDPNQIIGQESNDGVSQIENNVIDEKDWLSNQKEIQLNDEQKKMLEDFESGKLF